MCCNSRKTFAAFIPLIIGISVAMTTQSKIRQERPPRLENPVEIASMQAVILIPNETATIPSLAGAVNTESPLESVPPAPAAAASSPSEITTDNEAETVMNAADTTGPVIGVHTEPLLPVDRPDWIARAPQITDTIHYLSVGGELAATFEESLKSIDTSLLVEGRRYIDQYLIDEPKASELKNLTADWIRSHWLVENKTYDAEVKVPSGTYHQAWVELRVSLADREIVKQWYQERKRQDRVANLGIVAIMGIGGVGLLRGVFGFASRKSQPA